jgi:hypothetical protein
MQAKWAGSVGEEPLSVAECSYTRSGHDVKAVAKSTVGDDVERPAPACTRVAHSWGRVARWSA